MLYINRCKQLSVLEIHLSPHGLPITLKTCCKAINVGRETDRHDEHTCWFQHCLYLHGALVPTDMETLLEGSRWSGDLVNFMFFTVVGLGYCAKYFRNHCTEKKKKNSMKH